MDVPQLFDSFVVCPDVEIIEPRLPERLLLHAGCPILRAAKGGTGLIDKSRRLLLHNLNRRRKGAVDRFTHEQMNVFRHDDVARDFEFVSLTSFLENGEEDVSARGCA